MSTETGESSDSDPLIDIESTTVDHAEVAIHGHPFGRLFVDVATRHIDVQIPAKSVSINGASLGCPDRAIYLWDVSVTHTPDTGAVDISVGRPEA